MIGKSAAHPAQATQRRDSRRLRDALPDSARISASEKIGKYVTQLPIFRRSRFIACYLSVGSEVDTAPIILRAWRAKKRIFAPITRNDGRMFFQQIGPDSEFRFGNFGVPEPVDGRILDPRSFDLVLAPVVAFDAARNRIGMGGGYYDRTFSFLGQRKFFLKPKILGLAFDCQKIEEIVPNPWDIRVFRIVTESSTRF
jgi:5-formyltetrahydrofolate cyclo-ligase